MTDEPASPASFPVTAAPAGASDISSWSRRMKRVRTAASRCVRFSTKWGLRLLLVTAPLWLTASYLLYRELKTSRWQAHYLTRIAKEATFSLGAGPSAESWFPAFGPYDERLGYTRIPAIVEGLTKGGYAVVNQARQSPRFLDLASRGIYPPYREKTRTGITILDRNNSTIYSAYRPERVYDRFDLVPDLVVKTLLYIENREILEQTYPTKNPAIEWDRLGKAVFEKARQILNPDLNAPGGSTIATQLEKYRHSKEGRTGGIKDKLRQMAAASLRAYMYGEETLETRKLIVLQYINSIPLAALPGYGEVNGLGDGLWAWYGADFDDMNRDLAAIAKAGPNVDLTPYARTYKEMLSLFIAHRRPSFYLIAGLSELDQLTNVYLDLLAQEGVIPEKLRDACKGVKLSLQRAAPKQKQVSFVQRKAANAIRTRLLQLMSFPQLYDLDQVDVSVKSTMDNEASEAVTNVLRQIKDQDAVKKLGLGGARNLDRGDPSKVIYSLTLYERVGNANLLRVQTDNFNKPFSINEGTRLDLGSTAKLRTLTTYLDVVSELYEKYAAMKPAQIKEDLKDDPDPITSFVGNTLLQNSNTSLQELLTQAMERRYSANPGESFFTGGGLHHFENFKKEDNGRVATLTEALTFSLNLPFIRLMRDLERYYTRRLGVTQNDTPTSRKSPMRMHFLQKFADQEGSHFMRQFYKKYKGLPSSELLPALISNSRATAKQAAVMFRYVRPEASLEEMTNFLGKTLKNSNVTSTIAQKWYDDYGPGKFTLNDQGYLARIHPLELWLVKHLQQNPGCPIDVALDASKAERQHVYEWLFKTPHVRAQDIRIRTLIETEAFLGIHKQWRKMGYPFNTMVPSLASAIGSSGDRPAALAELVGIILNDGVRYPLVRLDELHFASNTPFETVIRRNDTTQGERVLKVEVARTLKRAMANVVEHGTARRVFNTFVRSDGKPYVIGGKTGTGDHRHETYGPGGRVISSRVVNRTATFVFYIGDRFFGVISAHVPGADAAKFDFTSALAAELLKILGKSLVPMIEGSQSHLSPFENEPKIDIKVSPSEAAKGSIDQVPAVSTSVINGDAKIEAKDPVIPAASSPEPHKVPSPAVKEATKTVAPTKQAASPTPTKTPVKTATAKVTQTPLSTPTSKASSTPTPSKTTAKEKAVVAPAVEPKQTSDQKKAAAPTSKSKESKSTSRTVQTEKGDKGKEKSKGKKPEQARSSAKSNTTKSADKSKSKSGAADTKTTATSKATKKSASTSSTKQRKDEGPLPAVLAPPSL